jgi:hypothetical protein
VVTTENFKKIKEKIRENIQEKLIKNRKRILIGAAVTFSSLLIIYLGMSLYFINHFYIGTTINGISVSGKSVKKAEEKLKAQLRSYVLNLEERGDKSELITAVEVGLKYEPEGQFVAFKGEQNPFKWLSALLNREELDITAEVSYDKKLLMERIDKLRCFDSSNVIEPKNPSFKYEESGYVIVDEVQGNKVDKDILQAQVSVALLKRQTALDLEAVDCYVKPQYTSKSQKIIEVRDVLNKYVSSKITYTFGASREVLDGSVINTWLTVDENFDIILEEEKIKSYIAVLASRYNTIGKTRSFVTSAGKTINIGGGDYGWSVNRAKEIEALRTLIKEGKTVTRDPMYSQTAFARGSNDIGSTYVEIDMAKQYIWFYKNGQVIAQGSIVTGNVSAGHTTPEGVYSLKYKVRNTVLRGADYAAPVAYWMPFNGGIGMHDANWRSTFGGNIYRTNGSHGCINCPYNLAKTIYDNIQPGTPIICHNNR